MSKASTTEYKIHKRPKDDVSDNENQDDEDSKGNDTGLNVYQNEPSSKSKPVTMMNNTEDKPSTNVNAVDLSIFRLKSKNGKGKIGAKELSIPLRRILEAYRYFQSLDTNNNKKDAEIFGKFIEDNYVDDVMNDYQHFMMHHKENINKIKEIVKSQPSPSSPPVTYCALFEGLHFHLMNLLKSTQEAKENDEKQQSSKPRPTHKKRSSSMLIKANFDKAPYDEKNVEELSNLSDEWLGSVDTNVKNLGIYLKAVIDGFKSMMNKDLNHGYIIFGAYARIFCECMCKYLLRGEVFYYNRQYSLSEMIDILMDQLEDEFQTEDFKDLEHAMHFVRDNTNKFVHCVAYNKPADKRYLNDTKKQELFNQISFIAMRLKEIMNEEYTYYYD